MKHKPNRGIDRPASAPARRAMAERDRLAVQKLFCAHARISMFRWKVTDELELQLVEHRHAAALYTLTDANRQHLRQWLPWVDATRSVADTATFITSSLQQFAAGKGFKAGIWYQGRLCGMIGHHEMSPANRATSLGYWLAADYQGKGIMTACCRAVVSHAFAELKLHRIVIRCAVENRRSRAIPERLGFACEGIARQAEWLYDHFVDIAVYALLHPETADSRKSSQQPPRCGGSARAEQFR
jgi:ribosomal-protein-serine acetyltransferase